MIKLDRDNEITFFWVILCDLILTGKFYCLNFFLLKNSEDRKKFFHQHYLLYNLSNSSINANEASFFNNTAPVSSIISKSLSVIFLYIAI
ncbi:hypothetical protein [Fusobacterium animalis]|uniref:hypothetical protein n=1 Tax=Fusobacterium animalis TaxID=76859 RepID=UPI0030CDA03F